MFLVFYTVEIVYICVFTTCSTSYCPCDMLIDLCNLCVCMYVYIYIYIYMCVCVCMHACIYVFVYMYVYIQGVPGGMCQTSGECSLC